MALFIPALFAGARKIFAVVYDGVGDYLKHTGGPTGAADGTTGTIVWAGTFNSDGSAMSLRRVINGSGTVLSLRRTATNTIEFKGWDATATTAVFSNVSAAVTASLGFLIIIATCNGTSSTLNIIHAAGTITGTNTPGAAANIDWTADWWYGQDGASGEFLDADTAMWWDDLTVVSNTEQFWDSTNDTLRDPGSDGSNPLDGDHAPLVCHVNSAATHTTNRGSGGDADVGTTFEDGTSPGAYSPDFVPAADVARLDAAASGNTDSPSYSVSAGSDRCLIVAVTHEGAITAGGLSVTYGGQSMTEGATVFLDAAANDLEISIFYLLEAGIAAASGSTIAITGETANAFTWHAISYENVSAINATNSDSTAAATPNPLTDSDITVAAGSAAVAVGAVGVSTSASWGSDLTEQTDQADDLTGGDTTTGSLADGLFSSGQNVNVECTWASQNRAAVCAMELVKA